VGLDGNLLWDDIFCPIFCPPRNPAPFESVRGFRGAGERGSVGSDEGTHAMTQADSEAPRPLGQPIEIDPVTALEQTARETVDEAASYIAQAIETDDAAQAKVLYGLAAGVLKTAATAVAELRKEAARQS
jgi:hypothetical protein